MNDKLNRAVAEHVMGLKFPRDCPWHSPNQVFFCELPLNHSGNHKDGNMYWDDSSGNCSPPLVEIPSYSTDPRETEKVIEKMRETHHVEIRISSGSVSVSLAPYDSSQAHIFNPGSDDLNWKRTLCLAALRAHGVSTKGLSQAPKTVASDSET